MVKKISDTLELNPEQLEKAMGKSRDPQFQGKVARLKEIFSLKGLAIGIFRRKKDEKQEESQLPTIEEITAARNYNPADLSTVKVTSNPEDDDFMNSLIEDGTVNCNDNSNFFEAIGNTFEKSRVVQLGTNVWRHWQKRLTWPELINRIAYFWILHKGGIKKIVEENEMTEVSDDIELSPELLAQSTTIFLTQNGSVFLLMPHHEGIEIHYNRVPFHESFAGQKPDADEQEVVYTVKPQEISSLKERREADLKNYLQMVPLVIYIAQYSTTQEGQKILQALQNHHKYTRMRASAGLPSEQEKPLQIKK